MERDSRAILTMTAIAVALSLAPATGSAFQQFNFGDQVEILLPADGRQPEPPQTAQDKLIFTGGKMMSIDIAGCGAYEHPMQTGVIIDTRGGGSGAVVVITTNAIETVQPGTRLVGLSATGTCTVQANGTIYNRYIGTVE